MRRTPIKVLIDGDIIVYASGHAAQQVTYRTPDGMETGYIKRAREHCELYNLDEEDIERVVEAEPLSHVLHNVSSMINGIIKDTGADEYQIFLSGEDNFRESVATIRPYKGTRTVESKPVHYNKIKEYIITNWGAEVVDGMEADDMLGISQDIDTVIASLDKDLDMIPGNHYNWRTKEMYYITEEEGTYNFYKQLLTGDTTDNIQGVPGIGTVKAERILKPFRPEEEYFWDVLAAYNKSSYDFPMLALIENAQLLYILREDGAMWEPPA